MKRKNKDKKLINKLNYTIIICPKCKSSDTVPILYGKEDLIKIHPAFLNDEANGKIILKNNMPKNNKTNIPHNLCKKCNYQFSIQEVTNV